MISALDDSIRQILIKEGGFDPSEVDVSFDLPNREWSGGIAKPTLNCYLFDIHEKRMFREDGWELEQRGTSSAARRRPPRYFELTYLITAWTRAIEDEHRLLWHVLCTMLRFPLMPAQHLQGPLVDYSWPIHIAVAQQDGALKSLGEFWSSLENHLRPSLSFVVTLALDTEMIPAGPPVLSTSLRVRPAGDGSGTVAPDELHTVVKPPAAMVVTLLERELNVTRNAAGQLELAGTICGGDGAPLVDTSVAIDGQHQRVRTDAAGQFRLVVPVPGRHTLLIRVDTRIIRRTLVIRDPGHATTLDLGARPDSGVYLEAEGGDAPG